VQLSGIPFRPVTPKIGHPFALASHGRTAREVGYVLVALAQQLALGIDEASPGHLFSRLTLWASTPSAIYRLLARRVVALVASGFRVEPSFKLVVFWSAWLRGQVFRGSANPLGNVIADVSLGGA
jgi:hypothetical protein